MGRKQTYWNIENNVSIPCTEIKLKEMGFFSGCTNEINTILGNKIFMKNDIVTPYSQLKIYFLYCAFISSFVCQYIQRLDSQLSFQEKLVENSNSSLKQGGFYMHERSSKYIMQGLQVGKQQYVVQGLQVGKQLYETQSLSPKISYLTVVLISTTFIHLYINFEFIELRYNSEYLLPQFHTNFRIKFCVNL